MASLVWVQAGLVTTERYAARTCQRLVSLCDGLGKVGGSCRVRVLVGVEYERQLPVRLLHLFLCCPSVDLHNTNLLRASQSCLHLFNSCLPLYV